MDVRPDPPVSIIHVANVDAHPCLRFRTLELIRQTQGEKAGTGGVQMARVEYVLQPVEFGIKIRVTQIDATFPGK